jgi:hypothetical protein
MRDSANPTRDASMRRLAFLGLVFVVAIVSCGKDLTGPNGAARFMRGLSWNAVFPPALRDAGGTSSGVVAFNRVHVVMHHSDGTVSLDTTIAFPPSADTLLVSLTVKLLTDAPASGEQMSLNLGYLNAAGDTVFKGGPVSITAAPRPPGGGVNPPVQVPVAYTGPGASATAVVIAPRTISVASGAPFTFTAIAKDISGDTLAGTPVIWTSLDPTIATITAPAAGTGVALNVSGTARILAQLLTGAADTVQLIVTLPASQLLKSSGDAQSGTTGVTLAQPLVAKVATSGGIGVAGTTVVFAVVTGGGSVTPTSAVTDANGLATTNWTLGATVGAQSVSATAGVLTPVTFTATAASGAAGLRTWTGATSNAWTTASNWSPAVVPGGGDSVFVPVTSTLPTLASATTIKSLTIAPSAILTLSSTTLTLTGSLDATGGITGTGAVALNSATGATVKGNVNMAIPMAGLYTVTGALSATGLQLTNSASLDINGQTVAIGAGGISTASTATIVMTQAASVLGTTGSALFGGGDETGKLTAGTLNVGGNFSEGTGNAAAFNAGPAHNLILSSATASSISMADPTTSQIGNLSIVGAGGVTVLTAFTANNVTIATGALSGTAGATINGTLTDPLAHWSAGNITFNTSATPVSASTPSISPTTQITFNASTANLAGNLVVNGAVNLAGNLTVNSHTLTVNGALTTSGSGQLTMTNAADVVNVGGNVTFGSTGTGGLMSAGTLSILGNFLQSGSSQSISTSGTNTIVFNGAGTQTVTFSAPDGNYAAGCVAACFQNLTVNKSGGQLNILTAVKVQGNFVNNSTTVVQTPVANGPFIVAGNATFGQNGSFARTGVGGTTFSKDVGTLIDSVSYFGAGQTYNPATLGEVYSDIRGTAQWSAGGTLTGQLVLSGAGALNVSTSHAIVTGNFTSSGTSTLAITTNGLDSLMIGGNATFGGGASTGLLTTGTLVVTGNISVTGLAIDGSGAFTTVLNGTTGTQTMTWASPVAGKGYNNLTLRGAAQHQFSGPQTVVGNMLIGATSGNVNGSFVLTFGGNITDSTVARNAWNGSSVIVMTGSPTVLPRNFGVNTLTFSGGTVTLADTLKGLGSIVVDGAAAHLKLNGHYVGLSSNFTTQNGGVLEMTNTRDSLDVGGAATFNGGNTSGLLTHGFINVKGSGFSQGVNATAFVADSTLRVSVGFGGGTTTTFANPGFGPTLSHFGEFMIGDGSTHTLGSDVFVQGQLTTNTGPQFPITSANHIITAQGANATNLFLTNTRLLLVDGSRVTTMTNVQFLSMDPTVTQFEVQRSGTAGTGDFAATLSAPIFNTVPTSGLYLKATDTNGATPFVTINVTTPNPASAGTFVSAVSNAVINRWPVTATASSTKTGTWSDPTVWSTGVVPGSSDNVAIVSPFVVTVTAPAVARNLLVNANSTLTLNGTNTLTVSGTPTTTGGIMNCTADNIVLTGTTTLTGSWCGIRVAGSVTNFGTTTVSGLLNIASGTLLMTGSTLNATTFQTAGTGVFKMTSTDDIANISGNASFNGGTETGALIAGQLTINGNFSVGTGAMFNASGSHTTQFAGGGAQTIGWTTPVASVGFNNVLFSHSWPRQFTSDAYIGGSVQIFSNDTISQQSGTAFVSGAHRVTLGGTNVGVLDQSIGGAWRVGATNFALPGPSLATSSFANLSSTDTTIFSGGGTVTLPPGSASKFVLLTKNVILDNSTNLNLNGGLLNTQSNSFTTQNGATLQMSAFSNDSLDAGHAYFNGGATNTTLLGGGMSLTGLYQGFTPAFATVPTASALAFAPAAGLHTYFKGSATTPDTIAFANPGTGAAGSHFYFLQDRITGAGVPPAPVVLRSDIFVDSLLQADVIAAIYNSDALGTTVRAITTKGFSNTGTVNVTLGGVALNLVQGPTPFANFSNVTWNQFPASYTGVAFTQNRTTAGPIFNQITYSALTFGASGEFATNLGSAGMAFGTGVSNPGCASKTLTAGQSCK